MYINICVHKKLSILQEKKFLLKYSQEVIIINYVNHNKLCKTVKAK